MFASVQTVPWPGTAPGTSDWGLSPALKPLPGQACCAPSSWGHSSQPPFCLLVFSPSNVWCWGNWASILGEEGSVCPTPGRVLGAPKSVLSKPGRWWLSGKEPGTCLTESWGTRLVSKEVPG